MPINSEPSLLSEFFPQSFCIILLAILSGRGDE